MEPAINPMSHLERWILKRREKERKFSRCMKRFAPWNRFREGKGKGGFRKRRKYINWRRQTRTETLGFLWVTENEIWLRGLTYVVLPVFPARTGPRHWICICWKSPLGWRYSSISGVDYFTDLFWFLTHYYLRGYKKLKIRIYLILVVNKQKGSHWNLVWYEKI